MKLKHVIAYTLTVIVLFTSGCATKTISNSNDREKKYTIIKVVNKNILDKNISLSIIDNHLKSLHKNLIVLQPKDKKIVTYKYYISADCTSKKNHLNRLKNILTDNTISPSEKIAIATGSVRGYNSVCKTMKEAKGENACEYARNIDDYLQILQNDYDNCKKNKVAMLVLAVYSKINNNFSVVTLGLRPEGNKKTLIENIFIVKKRNMLYFVVKNKNKSEILQLNSVSIDKNLKKNIVRLLP